MGWVGCPGSLEADALGQLRYVAEASRGLRCPSRSDRSSRFFAVLSRVLRCEIKVWRRSARRIPAAGEPLKEDWGDGHEAYKNASILQVQA